MNTGVGIYKYMSILISQFVSLYPTPMSTSSLCLHLFLSCKYIHQHHFSRFHVNVLIYDSCFSLSYLLYSVWQTLGLSASLQMTQFCSFHGWVIFHFMYVPHLLYPFRYWWTFSLLPCPGYCKLCCNEHQGTHVFLNCGFSQGICPGVGLLGHMILLVL